MKKIIRVLLVDDHELVRSSLKQLIESKEYILVVGEASNSEECIKLASTKRPDIILLDLSLNNESGFDIAKAILSRFKNIKILIVSMYCTETIINLSRKIGISGFVSKNSEKSELFYAIKRVFEGEEYFQNCEPQMNHVMTTSMLSSQIQDFKISKRELEIIHLISEGLSTKEIALQLNISAKTVENHRVNMLKKSGTKNTIQLLMALIRSRRI